MDNLLNNYILAIDQGTSSTKTIIFDGEGKLVSKATVPLESYHLNNGHVEQDPEGIYQNVMASVEECIRRFTAQGGDVDHIQGCGISNQRETFILWDKDGRPLYNAVVWQCKRSITTCEKLKSEGLEALITRKTGLLIDPYFSGTKLIWLYENNEKVRRAIEQGEAFFGTVDTWLLYKLTQGRRYYTDYTNASRTLFFNLENLEWDKELLERFGLSQLRLPEVVPSSFDFGQSDFNGLFTREIPITGMIGDSHAATFGEGCFTPGTAKATLGTGCSIMMNIGEKAIIPENGMVTTICWSTEDRVDYALEGLIVSCGATIEWLRQELGLFECSSATEAMATSVTDNNGVYLIPAFSGLGAPHWDMNRKASISGLTFGCNKNHIVRAALESIPYQIKDIISAMESDSATGLKELKVNGAITANQFVLQLLADLLEKPVVNQGMPDVSALGAAYLAGLKTGVYRDLEQLRSFNGEANVNTPGTNYRKIKAFYKEWQHAIGIKDDK